MSRPIDDTDPRDPALLALVRDLPRPAPSVADSKRLARAVDLAVTREQESRARHISPAWALLAVIVAASASAGVVALLRAPATPVSAAPPLSQNLRLPGAPRSGVTTTTTPEPVAVAAAVVPVAAAVPVAGAVPVAVPVAAAPLGKSRLPTSAIPKATPTLTWREQAQALVDRGDLLAAAHIYAAAVVHSDDPRGAALLLRGLVARDASTLDALDPLMGGIDDEEALARTLRLHCELGLRHRRDAAAVDACRVFGQRFPADAAARVLAFGAGGLAEELGDLRVAIDEYSRSIVLAPLAGASSNEALLGRARVRTRIGDLDEARGDLRVYLQQERRPAGTHSNEVQGLAHALRIELP